MLGTTPLLILKHKIPMDSRVVRQVFHYCYRIVAVVALAAFVGHALEGRPVLSACTGCIALMALVLHPWLLARMDGLRVTMHDGDMAALRRFRELHVTGVALNFVQLAAAIWAITQSKL